MQKFIKPCQAILFMIILFNLASCHLGKKDYDIITTLYPQYDIARQIAGDKLTVSNIIPFGSEAHGYEPTAKDIIAINEAKLFLFTSYLMEPWVHGLIKDSINKIDLSQAFSIEHELSGAASIHYWTDTEIFKQLIDRIAEEIIKIDPVHAEYYAANAQSYYLEIDETHQEMLALFNALTEPTVFFAGHNAMGAFEQRYNLIIRSLSSNFQPDADLTLQQLTSIITDIKEADAHYVFIEELATPRAAETIKHELKKENYELELLELHGYHNITKEQNMNGVRYADLLKQNFTNLKRALNH